MDCQAAERCMVLLVWFGCIVSNCTGLEKREGGFAFGGRKK